MTDQPPRILCCWPGLAGLWLNGHWASLLVAAGFSLILNLALVSTFVWPQWLDAEMKLVLWPAVLVAWLTGGWMSWRALLRYEKVPETRDIADDTLFIQAQTEYLKGEFTQAELLLAQRLQGQARDAEARLMLAAIYRRTDRESKAKQQLENLKRLDTAIPWQFEIQREWQWVGQQVDQQVDQQFQDDHSVRLASDYVKPEDSNADESNTEDAKTDEDVKTDEDDPIYKRAA